MYAVHWNLPIYELHYIIKEATDSFGKITEERKDAIAIVNDLSIG